MHPDPLEFLYAFEDPLDQEIIGLAAACLAYGRVAQILSSITKVLEGMGSRDGASPRVFLSRASSAEITGRFHGFTHRFTTGRELSSLLLGVKRALKEHGSLERLFARGMARGQETILPALAAFVGKLREYSGGASACPSLLSSPEDGSACKRLNLFLRWMVRRDAVDPGPWSLAPRSKLVVPLDTHLYRIASGIGLTARRSADLKTALEVTRGFAALRPADPVRYDFALTRLGINPACRALAGSERRGKWEA